MQEVVKQAQEVVKQAQEVVKLEILSFTTSVDLVQKQCKTGVFSAVLLLFTTIYLLRSSESSESSEI